MSTTRPQCPDGMTCPTLSVFCAEGRCSRAEAGRFTAAPPAPAAGGGEVERRWVLAFEDERDFCRFASMLIGAAYVDGRNALQRFEAGSLWGERTHGMVTAFGPTSAPPAEPAAAPVVVEALEQARDIVLAAYGGYVAGNPELSEADRKERDRCDEALKAIDAALAAASAPRVAVRLSDERIARATGWENLATVEFQFARAVERASWEANGLKEPT